MFNPKKALIVFAIAILVAGCSVSGKRRSAVVLESQNATEDELEKQVNYLATVNSMRAKMYLKFEDNSKAQSGSSEVYSRADGDVIVQRPGKIRLKVEVPVLGTDVASMTSDSQKFRVAILQDGGDGSKKTFLMGTNAEDYTVFDQDVDEVVKKSKAKKKVGDSAKAFSNIRPQHFTDALLVDPVDREKFVYTMSPFQQEEVDFKAYKKKDRLGWVIRGYYFFDEYEKIDTKLVLRRRFWFDRAGGALLSRLQIFGKNGEIESDIVYGKRGRLTKDKVYNLPLEVRVTRPQEKYTMTFTHAAEQQVKIGRSYPDKAFVLENEWGLREVDLDERLRQLKNGQPNTANPFF